MAVGFDVHRVDGDAGRLDVIWPTYWVWPLPYSGQRSCVFKPSDITINCRTSGESGEKPGVSSMAAKRTLHLFVKSSGID